MNTYRPTHAARLTGLALAAIAIAGCSESDLEELQTRRLDAAAAGASSNPELGAAVPVSAGSPVESDPGAWVLVFNDEFEGLTLDAARWNSALPWGPDITINDEEQYYVDVLGDDGGADSRVTRSPFSFDGEALTIAATRVSDAPDTPEGQRAAGNGRTWLSGVLTSAEKFDFTYGYVEARVDLPVGQALWPSIWMLGAEPIELRPQLYVMEHDGGRPDRLYYNYEYIDDDGNLRSPGQFEAVQGGLSEGFHTIGVAWSPEEFLFYLDGVPRYRIIGNDVSRQDMYLALPFAVGGTFPGASGEGSPSPANWAIDYVRVWQRRDPG